MSRWRNTVRVLVANYVATFLILLAANVHSVGIALENLQQSLWGTRVLFGAMGLAAALTFFLLFGYCLYHWGTQPATDFHKGRWLLVLLLLNFVGVVIYYLLVIEREAQSLPKNPLRDAAIGR